MSKVQTIFFIWVALVVIGGIWKILIVEAVEMCPVLEELFIGMIDIQVVGVWL